MSYLKISDVHVYQISLNLTNAVWDVVQKWDWFAKKTVGTQFVTAVDSISANLAEGFGRYHKKDKIKHYHYALGSRTESEDWVRKAFSRKLLTAEQHSAFLKVLEKIRIEIWMFIKITNEKLTI